MTELGFKLRVLIGPLYTSIHAHINKVGDTINSDWCVSLIHSEITDQKQEIKWGRITFLGTN